MDQLQQCPVCTLFLHSGMSLEEHLDTHPKDQVIRALCKMSGRSFGSRCTTPAQSERSYCSRSRTPASQLDGRATPKTSFSEDKERRKRAPRTPAVRCDTPANTFRSDALSYDSNSNAPSVGADSYMLNKLDGSGYARSGPTSDASHYVYMQEQPLEEVEVKYSRSDEYSLSHGRTDNSFTYNTLTHTNIPRVRHHTASSATSRSRNDGFDELPKNNNNLGLLKTSIAPVQYVNQAVKPLQFMVPTAQGYMQAQQNSNNMIISGGVGDVLHQVGNKNVVGPIFNQLNQMSTGAFTPGTTVVTQNSQFFYREMVHNIDGKPYLSAMPAVVSVREDLPGATQNPIYQNVMVVNPYTNSACMYPPQQIMASTSSVSNYEQSISYNTDKRTKTDARQPAEGQTLIIEVGPIESEMPVVAEPVTEPILVAREPTRASEVPVACATSSAEEEKRIDFASEMSKTRKGLKILSNIKVEVPIQHHKSMLHEVMDLTAAEECDEKTSEPCQHSSEAILPDIEDSKSQTNLEVQLSTSEGESVINTFSVIKNIGNPSHFRESTPKCSYTDAKVDVDQNDSCSIPDLTCKEKASISPCSEMSGDFADTSLDSCPPRPPSVKVEPEKREEPTPMFRNNPLNLNNLYVKKNKKLLQVKNLKTSLRSDEPCSSGSDRKHETSSESNTNKFSLPSTLMETFKQNNVHCAPAKSDSSPSKNEKREETARHSHNDSFDADTEEQSMDIEPISHSTTSYKEDFPHIPKSENSQTDEGRSEGFCSEAEKKEFVQLETMRPVNVIAYGSMNGFNCDANNKEFDASTLSKDRFVSMMSDNYFGDNIIGDYFTPDRAESFTNMREERQPYCPEVQKTELPAIEEEQACNNEYIWGESSQREPFILPNFIHESYKVADYSTGEGNFVLGADGELEDNDYAELTCRQNPEFERVSKLEISEERSSEAEVALDICADERMPPRGELSGQESNGDMDTPWSGMYHNINSSTSYDLIARETWVSDSSDIDVNEKTDNLEDELDQKMKIHLQKRFKCATCGLAFDCPKERRVHRAKEHPMPSTATSKTCKLVRKRLTSSATLTLIKKEEKVEEPLVFPSEQLVTAQLSAQMPASIADMLDSTLDAKPNLKTEVVIKEEPRRRRRDYVCPVCKLDLLNDLAFHEHLKLHPLECLTCGKYFYRRANLQLHIRTHLKIKNYKCEVCEKRFSTKQKLIEHHNIHTGAAPVKCSHCTAMFRRHSNMIQHRNRHHFHLKKKIRDYVCHCGEVLHSRRKLLWHKETHDGKPKACTYCSDKFVHSASLTRHIRRAHNRYYVPDDARTKENTECPICKRIYLKNNIEMHLQTHTGKKPFSCVICNKSFSTKWNLKLHRWTHANRSAKPFKCALCKGAFIRQADYIAHMNSHKSVRPYTCNYCGCQFIRKYNCQRHVKEHETSKKYVCKVPECGKMFHRSYYLTEHMRVHSGARPFSCNICGKTSSNKSNHNKHVKIHHAREPVATEG